MKKVRLDTFLVEQGFFSSRERARGTIMAGKILVNDQKIEKPGTMIQPDANIRVLGELHPFVSRGGLKLQRGLAEFGLDLKDKIMADVGASTGGFTDCALQAGAKRVYAIDVGYGQLDWKLRQDARVVVWERTNIRNVTPDCFADPIDFCGVDVSFISLKLVLPVVRSFLQFDGEALCLIKPQFEAGKERIGKKGVVRDSKVHIEVVQEILSFAKSLTFGVKGLTYSPITGPEGNIEFLAYLGNISDDKEFSQEMIEQIVEEAHQLLGKGEGKET